VQWLRDEMGFIDDSSQLEALATSVSDSAGVQFIPAFTGLGSPFWRADARGSITGLSRGVGRGQIARALVEALAYQVRAMTDAFNDGGISLHELRADGGAAAVDLMLQLQASNSKLQCCEVRPRSEPRAARRRSAVSGPVCGRRSMNSTISGPTTDDSSRRTHSSSTSVRGVASRARTRLSRFQGTSNGGP